MTIRFAIEDESHAEQIGVFDRREDALAEARRRAALPWDSEENRAPCMSWRTCGRTYELLTYDADQKPGRPVQREPLFEISAKGVTWPTPD